MSTPFETCSMCHKEWINLDSFLDDETLVLNGYGADFENVENGLFYFTHTISECCSTIAIRAGYFFDLYTGEKYSEDKKDSDECRKLCLKKECLDRCTALCERAFVREIIQMIVKRKDRERKASISYIVDKDICTVIKKEN